MNERLVDRYESQRRGLTLIELLAALTLLSGLVVTMVSWTTTASSASRSAKEYATFRSAARATLQCILDDVISGDFIKVDSGARVLLVNSQLVITTRSRRPATLGRTVVRTYLFDQEASELRTITDDPGSGHVNSVLLGDLASAVFELHTPPPDAENEPVTLVITLASIRGQILSRSVIIP